MSRDSHSVISSNSVREGIVLLPEDAELIHGSHFDEREKHYRHVAQLKLLWTNRRFLWRAVIFGLLFSILTAFAIPARYTSTVRLMPPDSGSSSGFATVAAALSGQGDGMTDIASDVLGLKTNSDMFVGIIGSRTAQDALIQKFDLRKVYWDRRIEDARRDLADHTGVSVDRKSQIITVSVSDGSPTRAAAMAQAYVDELDHLVVQLSTSTARRERIFLEARLQQVKTDLESAEKEFSVFASKNTAIDIKEQGKALVDAAAAIQGELIATESELEGLKQIYADNNVRVRSLTARVVELQQQMEKLGGKRGSALTLESEDDSTYPSIRKLPLLGVPYADLYRKIAVQETVFETLTREYELAKVQEVKEIPTVKVLDSANVPDQRSYPPRGFIVVAGTICVLICALVWVCTKALWDELGSDDSRRIFAEEVYGTMRASLPGVRSNVSVPVSEKGELRDHP